MKTKNNSIMCIAYGLTALAVYAITFVETDVNESALIARANQKVQVCQIICEIKNGNKVFKTVGTGTVITIPSGRKAVLTAAHVVDKTGSVRIEFFVKGRVIPSKVSKIIKYPRYLDKGAVDPESLKTDFALIFCDIPDSITPICLGPEDLSEIVKKANKHFFATFIGYGDHGVLGSNGFVAFKNTGRVKRYMGCPIELSPQTKLEIYANLLQESFSKDLARQLRETASNIKSDDKVFYQVHKELNKRGLKFDFGPRHLPDAVILQIPPYRSRNVSVNMAGFTNHGDSGGPLFMGDSNNIIGVCVAGRPGDEKSHHFTRYQSFFNSYVNYDVFQWIEKNLSS
ncbi:MAG: serine protease [Holosporales bacterium]|jgi:hypothetical protein|nr:serine protease [Holosporales bacterium]